ncbi:hypothetical protein P4K96_23510, partial [Bacillus cereus]|nr:hypothetical protein [Bacillus cereus]
QGEANHSRADGRRGSQRRIKAAASPPRSAAQKSCKIAGLVPSPLFENKNTANVHQFSFLSFWIGIEWTKILYFRRNRTEKTLYIHKMM